MSLQEAQSKPSDLLVGSFLPSLTLDLPRALSPGCHKRDVQGFLFAGAGLLEPGKISRGGDETRAVCLDVWITSRKTAHDKKSRRKKTQTETRTETGIFLGKDAQCPPVILSPSLHSERSCFPPSLSCLLRDPISFSFPNCDSGSFSLFLHSWC